MRHFASNKDDPDRAPPSQAAGFPANLPNALRKHAAARPDSPAFVPAVGRALSYAQLVKQVDAMAHWLSQTGIRREQRIAIMLPAGCDLAAVITAVLCNAVAVPLDSTLPRAEFLELLSLLRIDAVLTNWEDLVPVQWSRRPGCEDGSFAELKLFVNETPSIGGPGTQAEGHERLALILRTSGTTAHPKLVASTHGNIAEWAGQMQRRLALGPDDRCLCVAPLHYSHGLQASLFAPLITGGSVAFPPRLDQRDDAADVLRWLQQLRPTWLSAGPTFLLSLLERISSGRTELRHFLRFVQTGGFALPERTRDQLTSLLEVPILEAYGMSEAGQPAAEGWSLAHRRPHTVGPVDAGRVAIMSDSGAELEAGSTGNIMVRGPGIARGYIAENGTLQSLVHRGWFNTGDLGFVSADGFLTLTGRRKEIINRGGEKIAPPEIDRALCRHPAVAEAAAFPVSHPRLGEDVAAAVVLRPGEHTTPASLRAFLRAQLSPFKVPHQIQLVEELAKGKTGKIDRQAIARQFLARKTTISVDPGSTLELEIIRLWKRLLRQDSLSATDDFFACGGDSLLAVQMREELEGILGLKISDSLMLEGSTPRELAEAIVSSDPVADNFLVPLRSTGSRQPLLFVDGDINGGGYYMRRIAEQLGDDRPVWLLRPFDATENALPPIEVMAGHYLKLVREAGIRPPYLLGGHCNGSLLALEIARQAEAAGEAVSLVALIDPISLNARLPFRVVAHTLSGLLRMVVRDPSRRRNLYERAMTCVWNSTRIPIHQQTRNLIALWEGTSTPSDRAFDRRVNAYFTAMASYLPRRVKARLAFFIPEESRHRRLFANHPWKGLGSSAEAIHVPGGHLTCLTTHVAPLSAKLRELIDTQ